MTEWRKQKDDKNDDNQYINDLLTHMRYFLYARKCTQHFNAFSPLILRQTDIWRPWGSVQDQMASKL